MAASSQLRFTPLPNTLPSTRRHFLPIHLPPRAPSSTLCNFSLNPTSGGSGGFSDGGTGRGGSGGGGNNNNNNNNNDDGFGVNSGGPIALLFKGWTDRVNADPQFPFKVLMEELVGVSACVLGDMSSRPNFGLSELDFVFSTLVVGSILNFTLMYLLAPTTTLSSTSPLSLLPSHIFQPGPYSLSSRLLTLISKGATFAAVGFAAGLVGTAMSNSLIALRKKMDPEFVTPNKPPPTLLNSLTWAAHMGVSSNLRYQTLNGVEGLMEGVMPTAGFKVTVLVLRCLNNVLGGVSFVALARLTGAQKAEGKKVAEVVEETSASAIEDEKCK